MFPSNTSEPQPPARLVSESDRILNGWKEIAAFMGRGVRTVQRWEALGLPVRRPHGRAKSAVIATGAELHTWMLSTPMRELEPDPGLKARVAQLEEENAALRLQLRQLQSRWESQEVPWTEPPKRPKVFRAA